MNKLFAVFFAFVLFFGCIQQAQVIPDENNSEAEQVMVSFEIFANGVKIVDQNVSFDSGINAFEALEKVTEVKSKQYDFGVFVTSIAGIEADTGHYWALYINGQYAEKSIDQWILEENTKIRFELEEIRPFP